MRKMISDPVGEATRSVSDVQVDEIDEEELFGESEVLLQDAIAAERTARIGQDRFASLKPPAHSEFGGNSMGR